MADNTKKKKPYNYNNQKVATTTTTNQGMHAFVDPSNLVVRERSTKTMFSIAIAAQNSQVSKIVKSKRYWANLILSGLDLHDVGRWFRLLDSHERRSCHWSLATRRDFVV